MIIHFMHEAAGMYLKHTICIKWEIVVVCIVRL